MRRDETWRAASRNSAAAVSFRVCAACLAAAAAAADARAHAHPSSPSLSPRPFRAVGGNDAYVWVHGRVRSRSCLIMHGSREHAAKKAARRHVHCPANVSLLDRSDTCYTRGHATFDAAGCRLRAGIFLILDGELAVWGWAAVCWAALMKSDETMQGKDTYSSLLLRLLLPGQDGMECACEIV